VSAPGDAAAVVFDLDGTLVDSRRDLATAVNRLRGELGLPALRVDQVEAMVGEGARILVERALADAPTLAISRERALERFIAHYDACCLETTEPYPGMAALVRRLAARWPLAILTNKPMAATRKLLDHFDWLEIFRLVVAGDSLPARKPDPAGIRHIAERLDLVPSSIVLVGDSRFDAETAAAAGCRLVLVGWGYGRPEDLAAARPDGRAPTVADLAELFGDGSILSA
jgi:phosphoglycolate phosphatase